uniref:Zinc finger FYVE domain-containing protein 26 n=1 Tax=Lygus hesperus TaxID=30085 RepID=A0A0A9Z2X9_LYGHE
MVQNIVRRKPCSEFGGTCRTKDLRSSTHNSQTQPPTHIGMHHTAPRSCDAVGVAPHTPLDTTVLGIQREEVREEPVYRDVEVDRPMLHLTNVSQYGVEDDQDIVDAVVHTVLSADVVVQTGGVGAATLHGVQHLKCDLNIVVQDPKCPEYGLLQRCGFDTRLRRRHCVQCAEGLVL